MDPVQATNPLADRRLALKLSIFAGLAALPPAVARAQERALAPPTRPLPVVDARFPAELAPGVFILPDKRIPLVPNVGIVVGRETVLVIDCGLGIESAENVLRAARELAPGRQVALTVTHAHPEHGFGAQVFKGQAHIFYNSAQRDHLARSGQSLLDGFRAAVLPPGQRHLLDGIVLTPPDLAYEVERARLDLGGREVQFRTYGTAHSPGDQIIVLPAERIVFAGDLIEERMFPIVPFFPPMIGADDIDLARWEAALREIAGLQPRLIVPGHGNLGGPEIAEEVRRYFSEVGALVRSAGGGGEGLEARIRAQYPTWENSEFIASAVRYLSQRG